MKLREYCKSKGLSSVEELSQLTDIKYQTLYKWYRTRKKMMECLVIGAVFKKMK